MRSKTFFEIVVRKVLVNLFNVLQQVLLGLQRVLVRHLLVFPSAPIVQVDVVMVGLDEEDVLRGRVGEEDVKYALVRGRREGVPYIEEVLGVGDLVQTQICCLVQVEWQWALRLFVRRQPRSRAVCSRCV